MSICTGTGCTVLPCRKRLKYSHPVSKEPSEICAGNNVLFGDSKQKATDNDDSIGFKNDSSSRLNEREISETLLKIKSENSNSDFMPSNAVNESKENEILKILWEMKAEQYNFQKEVLIRLQSIETEVNKLKNVLCLSQLSKTHIRTKISDASEPDVETERNNVEKSVCPCKHPDTQTADDKTNPSIIYLEPLFEAEINNINNAQGTSKRLEAEIPGETETNKIDKALCICEHYETEISRESTKPIITEISSEKNINLYENSLCYFKTSVVNDTAKPHAETDEICKNNLLSLYGNPEATIVPITRVSVFPKLPVDSIDALEGVEQWLKDKDNIHFLTQQFSTIGGDHMRDTVKRILARTFTQNIAVNINWTGKNNKYPLGKGCLVKVIIAAVKLTHKNEDITEKMVEEFIKVWFRFAKDRNGGRDRRRYASNYLREEEMLIIP